jgi:branched-chain amino acid transport system substrate-binding protein
MKEKNTGITRREFIKKTGVAGAALGAASVLPPLLRTAKAAERDFILIGRPNPSTGPLAGFGEASPWTDNRAIEAINKDGGIFIKERGKKLPVKIKMVDTESNPTKAAELAGMLILKDKVDLMIVLHTPDTVNPVSAMCERYKMPCIGLDAPVDAWLTGGPYHWTFHSFWTDETITNLYVDIWDEVRDQTNRVVGALWPNDPDGIMFTKFFSEILPKRGYRIVDPGRFPYFNKDFTSVIDLFKREKVEIVTGCPIPPDWGTAWKQFHQQGFVPKIATIAKACLFPTDVNALGDDLADGITSEVWWSPHHPFKSSLTGETPQELCDAWVKETGKEWTQPLGYKYAGFEIAADVLKRSGSLDHNALRESLAKTDLKTIVGPIKFNDKNYSETPLVGGQWVKGKKWPWTLEITNNQLYPQIKKTANMVFPIPK